MDDQLLWIVLPGPALMVLLLYLAASVAIWPYARPLLPLWLVIVALLPPLLPWLALYVLCCVPRPVLVVVDSV